MDRLVWMLTAIYESLIMSARSVPELLTVKVSDLSVFGICPEMKKMAVPEKITSPKVIYG